MKQSVEYRKIRRRRKDLCTAVILLAAEAIIISVLLFSMRSSLLSLEHEQARSYAEVYADNIKKSVEHASEVTEIMAYSVITSDGDTSFFYDEAAQLYKEDTPIRALELAPDGIVSFIYPKEGNENAGSNLLTDPERGSTARFGRDENLLTIQGPFELKQGGSGMAARYPVYLSDGTFWGFSIVIIDTPELVQETAEDMEEQGYSCRIEKSDVLDSTAFQTIASSKKDMDDPETVSFYYGCCIWKVSIEPQEGWQAGTAFRNFALTGISAEVLTAFLFFLVSRNRQRQRELTAIAHEDYLTGLRNRQGLEESMQSYFKAYPRERYTAVMIDIDDFKTVNDLYGHEAGDAALKALAERMKTCFGEKEIIGRYGGDEFCVILKHTAMKEAEETIRSFVKDPVLYQTDEGEKSVTISAGYAGWPESTEEHGRAVHLADHALYAGKLGGKHICMAYQPSMHDMPRERLGLSLKTLVSVLPLPFIAAEGQGDHAFIYTGSAVHEYLKCSDYAQMIQLTGGSLKTMLSEEDYEKVISQSFHQGARIHLRCADGTGREPEVYVHAADNEAHGRILLLVDDEAPHTEKKA